LNKIITDFPTLEDGFLNIEGDFCGRKARLTIPAKAGATWTKYNLHFRSLITDCESGEVLDIGFNRFCNLGETPGLYPNPDNYKDYCIETKLDGSTCIFTYFNGQLSIRTRGSFSYLSQANCKDFELIYSLYPKFLEFIKNHPDCSFLTEITTPNNIIVKKYDTVDFTLIGIRNKLDLSYWNYDELNKVAKITDIPRPKIFNFKNLLDIVETVKLWKNEEGVVLSFGGFQHRVKIKADFYCHLHRIKSELNSGDNLIDLFIKIGCPSYQDFFGYIEDTFDYEIANNFRANISKISDAYKKVKEILQGITKSIENIRKMSSRREQAEFIINSWGQTARTDIAFLILDNRKLENRHIKKLIFQLF